MTTVSYGQEFKNEEDRKKHANKLFDKGNYVEASPHILHFLSLNQTSPEYNFKYGVCLMYTDEDKEASLRYLRFAAAKKLEDTRVYFFLGKAYHLNYNFKAALLNYNKFKSEGEENYKEDLKVDLHIQMCKNGKSLLKNLTELVVYEKTESSFERFQYSYDLKEIGGKILVSAEFQSKYDKKVGYKSVVYFPPLNQDILFFSSYGKDASKGLDLYMVRRGASGDFENPEKLPETINTPFDDAYGFLHSDGKTFYFSSKGHTSMGGYDVFKVDYDSQSNQFGTPKNLDYKINTPDDDIMYVVDPNFENAYFSSSRAAKGGYLDVYKVKVETYPILNVILAGQFENKINAEDQAATIKVENIQSGEIEGIYNTGNAGDYVIVLPKSGKYKFIVETPGSENIHTGIVDIPSQKEIKPLKQTLDLVSANGVEKLVINNLFDQAVANADEIMAKVLKGMSDPEPNADDFPDSLYKSVDQTNVVADALDDNYSVDDLIGLSADKAKEVQNEADDLKKRMEAAFAVAQNKTNAAKSLSKQADDLIKEIETLDNPTEKEEKVALAKKANSQSKDLNMLATTALNLANALKVEYDKKQKEADDANSVAAEIKQAVNEDSHDKAIAALKNLQARIDNLITDQPNYKSGLDEIVQKAKAKQEEADKANLVAQEYRAADDELNLRLSSLETELEKSKKKDKPLVQRQIEDIKEQLLLNDEFAKESFDKSDKLQKEADELSHQVDLMTNLFTTIDEGTTVELTEEEKQQVQEFLASNELENNIANNESALSGEADSKQTSNTLTTDNSTDNVTNEVELTTEEQEDATAIIESEFETYQEEYQTLVNGGDGIESLNNQKEVLGNWIRGIDTKIEEKDNAIASTTDEKEKQELVVQKEWLEKEKSKKEEQLSQIENSIENIGITNANSEEENSTNKPGEENLLTIAEKEAVIDEEKANYESYETALSEIDLTGSDEEIANAKKQVNEDWITALDGQIMDVEDQIALTNDPKEKQKAEEKLAWLNEQKAEKEVDLNFIEEELATYSPNEDTDNVIPTTNNEIEALTDQDKEIIIAATKEKFKSFETELSNVLDNDYAQKTAVTERLITELNKEINSTKIEVDALTDSTEKQSLEAKLDWLNSEKSKRILELGDYNTLLASEENNVNNTIDNENNKAEDWLIIIDNDINDLQRQIDSEQDEDKKTELIEQKNRLEQLKSEKLNVVDTNTSIAEKSSKQKEIEETEGYKELVEEFENAAYTQRDFDYSFTSDTEYKNKEAVDLIASNNSSKEKISILEQEKLALENKIATTGSEKKKAKIQEEIDSKDAEILAIELTMSKNIEQADKSEYEANQSKLKILITEASIAVNPVINDVNYQSAKLLEAKYIEQSNEAKSLLSEAGDLGGNFEKVEKQKEAHAIQQAALKNQEEAITLLEEMTAPDYESESIGTKENLLVDNSVETPQQKYVSGYYIQNQIEKEQQLLAAYDELEVEEKSAFLVDWKSEIDKEIDNNMRLLTSDIPDEDKETISKNVEYLRNEQQKILDKQSIVSELADNNQENITDIQNTQESSQPNTTEDTNQSENNTTNNLEENNNQNSENNNTVTDNSEANENKENNNSTIPTLKAQKEVFSNFVNEIITTTSATEKEEVYSNWVEQLDNELKANKESIVGNITVDEEAAIQENIDWLENERAEKLELLEESKALAVVENDTPINRVLSSPKVSQQVIENSTLKDEVEGITFYSGNEDLVNYDVSTEVEEKTFEEQTSFESESANQVIVNNQSKLDKVKKYDATLAALEVEKEAAKSEKVKEKFNKKIEKLESKKARSELKVSSDLQLANKKEAQLIESKLAETKSLITDNIDTEGYAYKQAKEFETKAELLNTEANELRNSATANNNDLEKSSLLNEALAKEIESANYKEKAEKLYSEAIVNSYANSSSKLTTVSENEAERPSTEILNAANKSDNLAYEYNTRATELRDSSLTVKKKSRAAVIEEAENLANKADAQKRISTKLKREGENLKAKEDEILENELLLTNLTESDVEKIRTTENYDKIYNNQKAIDAFLKELMEEEAMMKSYRNLAKQQEQKVLAIKEQIKNTDNIDEQERLKSIAESLTEKAEENRAKEDSVASIINDINTKKEEVELAQVDLLSLFDEEMQADIRGLFLSSYDKTPKEKEVVEPAISINELTSSTFKAPEVLNTNIVVINNDKENSVYSDRNPIPLNPVNPKGLVYKVQVGAFRNPIPQNLFKGFAPISAEKINDDITRYRVGYFVDFGTANVSKNQIRQLGYPDAFVVAIINGKRVSMAEARAYNAGETTTEITNVIASNPEEENTTIPEVADNTIASNEVETQETNEANQEEVPEYVQNLDENAAEVNAVENIKGLFYTVQVGAFSKAIPKTGAFNISPLVTKYVNGLYKYTTGIYKSVQDADGRKEEVRAKGIPDAFVIAYNNGERISLIEANEIIRKRGNAAFATKAEGTNPAAEETDNNDALNDNSIEQTPEKNVTPNFSNEVPELKTENTESVESENVNTEIENESEAVISEEKTSTISTYAKPDYLLFQKQVSERYNNALENEGLDEQLERLAIRTKELDKEITDNMRDLVSDIPENQKDIISENVTWLRNEKATVLAKKEEVKTKLLDETKEESSVTITETSPIATKEEIETEVNEDPIVEEEIVNETTTDNEVETVVISEFSRPTYLTGLKSEAFILENNFENNSLKTQLELIENWNVKLESELTKNIKDLVSDYPESQKNIINNNVAWLRTEKTKNENILASVKSKIANEETSNNLEIENKFTDTEEELIVSEFADPVYLDGLKDDALSYEAELLTQSLTLQEAKVGEWKVKVEREISTNMKELVSDIPVGQKEVISNNVSWLRAEKQKADKKLLAIKNEIEKERIADVIESQPTEETIEETTNPQEIEEGIVDDNTYYIDLGIYYGTVPTPIAEALLTNKSAKVKRNKINNSATQYYCGQFGSKEEVTKVLNSFKAKGIEDANIVTIAPDQEFILMEEDNSASQNSLDSSVNEVEAEEPIVEEVPTENTKTPSAVNTNLVYRVELGTFNGSMPTSTGKVFLELGYLGIEKVTTNGKEIYYCGKVDTEAKARELQQKFMDKELPGTKVVAFLSSRKISLSEARGL